MTVTLGAEGNNFVLGGKHTDLCAEDAYTVGNSSKLRWSTSEYSLFPALDYSRVRQGRRLRLP